MKKTSGEILDSFLIYRLYNFNLKGFNMRISERKLREVIKSVISETADFHLMPKPEDSFSLVPKMVPKRDAGMDVFMQRAQACLGMDKSSLFDMCAQICASNKDMERHCVELCNCVAAGEMEMDRCCDCLEKICSCPQCEQICLSCCGC